MAKENGKTGRGGRAGKRWPLGRLARRHPFISAAAAVIGAGLVIFVLVWFQPQKLFLNKTVNEPLQGIIQTAPGRETNRNPAAGGSPPPGLRVYLSHRPASADLRAYRTGFIDLGALKGNRGNQNYAIPLAPTSRHSRARSSGAADSQSDSAWLRCNPELPQRLGRSPLSMRFTPLTRSSRDTDRADQRRMRGHSRRQAWCTPV